MAKAAAEPVDIPALGISVKSVVNGTMEVVFQSHFERDTPAEEINPFIDKLLGVVERQDNKFKLATYRDQLRQHESQINNLKQDLANVDRRVEQEWESGGRRGAFKRTPKQEQERMNALQVFERYKLEADKLRGYIADLEGKV